MRVLAPVGRVVLLAAALILIAIIAADARPATVQGADRVFLRRGAGLEFQPFTTVERGEQVDVEEVTGAWALVKAASNQRGYMHAAYLVYNDNSQVVAQAPAAAAQAAPAATAGPASDLGQQNADLRAEIEKLQAELADRSTPVAAPSPGEDLVALRAEVRRLADTTDAMRSRLDAPGPGGPAVGLGVGEAWATSTVVVIAAFALLAGWMMGAAVSRREERNKRTRIRF